MLMLEVMAEASHSLTMPHHACGVSLTGGRADL